VQRVKSQRTLGGSSVRDRCVVLTRRWQIARFQSLHVVASNDEIRGSEVAMVGAQTVAQKSTRWSVGKYERLVVASMLGLEALGSVSAVAQIICSSSNSN
jgi:hypothetical protein